MKKIVKTVKFAVWSNKLNQFVSRYGGGDVITHYFISGDNIADATLFDSENDYELKEAMKQYENCSIIPIKITTKYEY